MDPYEITVLTGFALRLGSRLQADPAELQIEGFPSHLDRIYGDLVVVSPAGGALLELKRNEKTLATEERKELRRQLIERLQEDEELRRVSLWCHWFSFLHDGEHTQARYLPELSKERIGDRVTNAILRLRIDFDAFFGGLYDTSVSRSELVSDKSDVGANRQEFCGYLRNVADLAGAADAETAAMCLEIEDKQVRLRVVPGFNALAKSLEPPTQAVKRQNAPRLNSS